MNIICWTLWLTLKRTTVTCKPKLNSNIFQLSKLSWYIYVHKTRISWWPMNESRSTQHTFSATSHTMQKLHKKCVCNVLKTKFCPNPLVLPVWYERKNNYIFSVIKLMPWIVIRIIWNCTLKFASQMFLVLHLHFSHSTDHKDWRQPQQLQEEPCQVPPAHAVFYSSPTVQADLQPSTQNGWPDITGPVSYHQTTAQNAVVVVAFSSRCKSFPACAFF